MNAYELQQNSCIISSILQTDYCVRYTHLQNDERHQTLIDDLKTLLNNSAVNRIKYKISRVCVKRAFIEA